MPIQSPAQEAVAAELSQLSAIPFTRGPLAHLLRNRFYIGEVEFKGEILAGEQLAIVDQNLFDAVQAKLDEQLNNHNAAFSERTDFRNTLARYWRITLATELVGSQRPKKRFCDETISIFCETNHATISSCLVNQTSGKPFIY